MSKDVISKINQFNDLLAVKKSALADKKKAATGAWKTSGRVVINGQTTNIRVVATIAGLVSLLALLVREKEAFDTANTLLNTNAVFEFAGHSFEDWVHDFNVVKSKIEIADLEKIIKKIEGTIESYTPEELRRAQAFDEVEALLQNMDL